MNAFRLLALATLAVFQLSCSSSNNSAPAIGATVKTMSLQGPAMTVAAGAETTQCVTIHLGNSGLSMVRRIHASFTTGLLRAIVYRTSASSESAAAPCSTATNLTSSIGSSNTLHPLFVSGQADLELQFPTISGSLTGPRIDDNQNVTIEATVYNPGASPLSFSGQVDFDVLAFPAGGLSSDLLLLAQTSINLPAHTATDSGLMFQANLAGDQIFALLPMQHRYGTSFKIWTGTTSAHQGALVTDATNWSAPGLTMPATPLSMVDSSQGLAYDCAWNNTGSTTVTYNLASTGETCFVWSYYEPAGGFINCPAGGSCTTPTTY